MTITGTASSFTAAAPPLSRDAARAVIAARLAQLDHAPDFFDGQATAALIDYAAGSPQRLRAALASTLFLASTEDALHVGRALVQRALLDGEARPDAPATGTGRFPVSKPLAGVAAAVLAVGLAAIVLPHRTTQPARLPDRLDTLASGRPAAQVLAPPATRPVPPKGMMPTTLPPKAISLSPTPSLPAPARAVRPAPTPPVLVEQRVSPPVLSPDILPISPQATAILMYTARDPAALGRLDAFVRRLRQAGIERIETRAVAAGGSPRRAVSYFFADDYEPAQTISAALIEQGWPRLQRNSLAPRLVLPPTGVPPRHPGLIEVRLP